MPTDTMPATDVAQRLVDAVTARLDTAHHEWEPASVLAVAMLDELDVLLDRHDFPLTRDFLQHVRQAVVATLPKQIPADVAEPFNVVRLGPRYATVLLVDALAHGPALMEGLTLHADSTLVVSLPSHLEDVALLDDVEVIDRTVAMPAVCREDIDKELERCKQRGERR
ncbi:hypothetical protein SK571_13610 [Lentzea sp. BCCO 10_0798]|uniref:Uncharacterized protein n=1 Tax=Lentzea kristufekii TaxID=3095430 RepID=A0ABU4TQ81_9PSEU|nr:hypothetical protein [Lentzea sp. BCCO 10_0798]MDX8050423.1 hypothetical protein [Lentzea sp. BCCO 10_0798]